MLLFKCNHISSEKKQFSFSPSCKNINSQTNDIITEIKIHFFLIFKTLNTCQYFNANISLNVSAKVALSSGSKVFDLNLRFCSAKAFRSIEPEAERNRNTDVWERLWLPIDDWSRKWWIVWTDPMRLMWRPERFLPMEWLPFRGMLFLSNRADLSNKIIQKISIIIKLTPYLWLLAKSFHLEILMFV